MRITSSDLAYRAVGKADEHVVAREAARVAALPERERAGKAMVIHTCGRSRGRRAVAVAAERSRCGA